MKNELYKVYCIISLLGDVIFTDNTSKTTKELGEKLKEVLFIEKVENKTLTIITTNLTPLRVKMNLEENNNFVVYEHKELGKMVKQSFYNFVILEVYKDGLVGLSRDSKEFRAIIKKLGETEEIEWVKNI